MVSCLPSERFLKLAGLAAGVVQLCGAISIAGFETKPWNIWFSAFLFLGASLSFLGLPSCLQWQHTRRYWAFLDVMSWLHLAHFLAGVLVSVEWYTDGVRTLRTWLVPPIFGLAAMLLMLCCRVKRPKIIADDAQMSRFERLVVPAAALIFSVAVSRFGNGVIPAPHCAEAMLGIAVASVTFLLPWLSTSAWGTLLMGGCGLGTVGLMVFGATRLGAAAPPTKQLWISCVSWCLVTVVFHAVVLVKVCLLREPFAFLRKPAIESGSQKCEA